MPAAAQLITDKLAIWSSAIKKKSAAGRGKSNKLELYGIKRLRELILELAVRGLLVPQSSDDEPASELLKKITAEKAKLLKSGKIKKPKMLSPIEGDEKPFTLPNGWEWVRLQDISEYIQRGKGPKYSDIGAVRVVSQKCIQWTGFNTELARYVDDSSLDKYQEERFLRDNDLLWNSTGTGTVGRINLIVDIESKSLVADSHVTVIRTLLENAGFVCSYISSAGIQNRIDPSNDNPLVSGTTNQVELNTGAVVNLPVPVPPFPEQHRIVAKVDELMALCDQLEHQQETSIAAHQTLVQTLLDALTTTSERDGFTAAWARIADHFDTLFTTVWSIDQLKQTILQLAVMGKLVPQDPNDEPASELLKKIASEKAKLVKNGKIKSQKVLPQIEEDEEPFELPNGWVWCRLDDIALDSEAGWSPRCEPYPREHNNWGVLKVSAVTWGVYKPEENKTLPTNLEPREKYEVQDGDFLISRANTSELVARAVVVPENSPSKLMMSDKIIRFRLSDFTNSQFVNLVNNSGFSRTYYAAVAGGTSSSMKNVSRKQIRSLLLPVPPKEEQIEIVGKVDQLMSLCDTLKTRINTAQDAQLLLADAMGEQAVGQGFVHE